MSKTQTKKGRRKPKQSKGAIAAEVMLILLFVLIALFFTLRIFYRAPSPDTGVPFSTNPNAGLHTTPSPVTQPGETTDASAAANPIEYIRREGVYNFLVLGRDRVATLTDVIILASYDVGADSLNLVQIPRDTYAEYTTGSYRKINGAYSSYLANGSSDAALRELMNLLKKNLSINIDYYVLIDLDILREMVDAIGGVYLNVPEDMDYDDPDQNLAIHLKAGPQTLNGEQAEQFVRFRSEYVQADIGRTDAQKIFISAFIQQYKKNLNLATLTKTVEQMIKHVTTNLTVADCVYFAKEALQLDMAKVTMVNMPGSDVREQDGLRQWYYVLSRAGARDVVNRYLNVYNNEITDAIFDQNYCFNKESNAEFNEIYHADIFVENAYHADQVVQDGIDIPRK